MADDLKALLVQSQSAFQSVAPKWFSVERLVHLMLSATSRQPALLECTKESFLNFCLRSAETGLEPIGAGGCWAVPFKNKYTGKKEVVFIPDWRGMIQLAKKPGPGNEVGQIKHAYGEVVKANDAFDYQLGDAPSITHKPALKDRGETVGAYCVCVLPDDSKHIEWMNREELDAIQNRSKAKDEGPWVTDADAMRIKTVVKRALKVFSASPQLQTAIAYDNQALGLALPEDRTPIMEPQALPPARETMTPPAPTGEKAKAKEASTPSADGDNTVTGVLEKVTEKPGKNARGPFIGYGLYIGDERYGTFDKTIGAEAVRLKGQKVTLTWTQDGKYRNVTAIAAAESPQGGASASDGAEQGDDKGQDATPDREDLLKEAKMLAGIAPVGPRKRVLAAMELPSVDDLDSLTDGQLADFCAKIKEN